MDLDSVFQQVKNSRWDSDATMAKEQYTNYYNSTEFGTVVKKLVWSPDRHTHTRTHFVKNLHTKTFTVVKAIRLSIAVRW